MYMTMWKEMQEAQNAFQVYNDSGSQNSLLDVSLNYFYPWVIIV